MQGGTPRELTYKNMPTRVFFIIRERIDGENRFHKRQCKLDFQDGISEDGIKNFIYSYEKGTARYSYAEIAFMQPISENVTIPRDDLVSIK